MDLCGEYEYKYSGKKVAQILVEYAKPFDFTFVGHKKIKGSWISVASPIVAYMTSFKHTLNEARLGTLVFISGKDKSDLQNVKPKTSRISDFGMQTHHAPLCHGITFPPELRGPMLKCSGPGTRIISYVMNDKTDFDDKYINILNQTFSQITGIEGLWPLMKKDIHGATTHAIVEKLMNISLGMTTREHRRATPPMSFLFKLLSNATYKKWVENFDSCPEITDTTKSAFTINYKLIDHFDFANKGIASF